MVARQCLGWSPASSGVGHPPILRPSARQALGWSPTGLHGAGRCQRPERTEPPGANVLYRLARRPCPRSRGRGLPGKAYYTTASPGALVPGREATASWGTRIILPRQAPLSLVEKPRPQGGCVLHCLARRHCPRSRSHGLTYYTASPGAPVPGGQAAASRGTRCILPRQAPVSLVERPRPSRGPWVILPRQAPLSPVERQQPAGGTSHLAVHLPSLIGGWRG